MRKAILFIAIISIETVRSIAEPHLSVTTAPSLLNPSDAVTAIERCSKARSWRVTLKANEPLTLELLSCSESTHLQIFKESDFDGWPYPYQHQVLLLERRRRDSIKIIAALYSELEFIRVEPGKIKANNTGAVIWTSDVKCGTCHAGPEGILVWNKIEKRYDWNASWLDEESQISAIRAALPENYELDEAESLFWSEDHSTIFLRAAVHTAVDAHCCPQGGGVTALVDIRDGRLGLSDFAYTKPASPAN
jgi:hypothetical protein